MDKVNGELIVIGKNSIEIFLVKRPRRAKVDFKDECKIVPCDPQQFDALEFRLFEKKRGKHFLEIKWDVSGSREVKWEVEF